MEGLEPLDRKEAAQHLVKLAFHVTALAKLFDPSIKASKVKSPKDAVDKALKPKRDPTAYTLYIKDQMPAFKEQARPSVLGQWRARVRPFARVGARLAGRARACAEPSRRREPRRSGRRRGLRSRLGAGAAALPPGSQPWV
jgi:hypothetical protein